MIFFLIYVVFCVVVFLFVVFFSKKSRLRFVRFISSMKGC